MGGKYQLELGLLFNHKAQTTAAFDLSRRVIYCKFCGCEVRSAARLKELRVELPSTGEPSPVFLLHIKDYQKTHIKIACRCIIPPKEHRRT